MHHLQCSKPAGCLLAGGSRFVDMIVVFDCVLLCFVVFCCAVIIIYLSDE